MVKSGDQCIEPTCESGLLVERVHVHYAEEVRMSGSPGRKVAAAVSRACTACVPRAIRTTDRAASHLRWLCPAEQEGQDNVALFPPDDPLPGHASGGNLDRRG